MVLEKKSWEDQMQGGHFFPPWLVGGQDLQMALSSNKEHIIVKSQFNSNLLTDHRQDALLEDHHGVLCLPQDVGAQPHDI